MLPVMATGPDRLARAGVLDGDCRRGYHRAAARARWPEHLPVGALRVVRWSARYDQTVIFYRDIIGLQVLETFHHSYGLDGTILGLPGGPVHLRSSSSGTRRTRPTDLISWCSTCRMPPPRSASGPASRRGCPPGCADRLLAGQRRRYLPGPGWARSSVRVLDL